MPGVQRMSRIGAAARALVQRASWLSSLVAGAAMVAIMVGVVADIAARNLRGRPIPGLVDYTEVVLVVVVFLALAQTQRRREHVAVEAVVDRAPAWAYRALRLLGWLAAIAVTSLLAWATADLALESVARGEFRRGLARVPLWPARVAVAIGFVQLTLELVLRAVDDWRRGRPDGRVFEAGEL